MVRLESVTKEYGTGGGSVKALSNVSLEITQSGYTAIMGPSGSGKSTLLHLLGGVDKPGSGKVWIGENCISDMDDRSITIFRRMHIGFVFQSFNLMPTLTVLENISLPLRIAGIKMHDYEQRVIQLVRLVGLEGRERHRPGQLSGGQQQRVAVARAFVTDPDIILLDEPTGNLDSKASNAVLDIIAEAHDKFHKTIVLVTHNTFAAERAESVVFLKDGQAVRNLTKTIDTSLSAKAINDIMLSL